MFVYQVMILVFLIGLVTTVLAKLPPCLLVLSHPLLNSASTMLVDLAGVLKPTDFRDNFTWKELL
jgi:hypothetical protein